VPTATGLPKVGEVWELDIPLPNKPSEPIRVVILERGRGGYFSLRVASADGQRHYWVDPSYWMKKGWLRYIGPAGPKTRAKLGLR